MDDKSREFLAATGGDAREAQTQPPKTEERAAFEAWYANRHPKPVHENATWAHASKVDDWEVWQARAALSSRPVQGGEPADGFELWHLVYGALVQNGKPDTYGECEKAAKRIADMLQRLALSSAPAQPVREPMSEGQVEQARQDWLYSKAVPNSSAFVCGVRFAERHHGITKE
jgi:hypothetical protein